jgi:quercetin dioxygenase-like cupin family protein
MRRLSYHATSLAWAALWLSLFQSVVVGQDSARVAPKNVKVLLENNRVRVLEVRIKPGEKIPMHSHPAHLTYALTDVKGQYTLPDGSSTVGEAKSNGVFWSEPVTHSSVNIGDTEIHAIVVEMKDPPKKKQTRN